MVDKLSIISTGELARRISVAHQRRITNGWSHRVSPTKGMSRQVPRFTGEKIPYSKSPGSTVSPCQWSFLVPLIGGRYHIIPPIGSIYHLYTTYILPTGWLYITCHLLREPETAIDLGSFHSPRSPWIPFWLPLRASHLVSPWPCASATLRMRQLGIATGFVGWAVLGDVTVDGSEILQTHQLRLVVSPIIYRVFIHPRVVVWDFFHQQYYPAKKRVRIFFLEITVK